MNDRPDFVSGFRRPLIAFAAGVLVTTAVTSLAGQTTTWGQQYRKIPAAYQKVIDDSEKAFMTRDVDGAGASMAEDFTWYRFTDKGPEEMVRGRTVAMERLKMFFSSPAWTTSDAEVHRLGMVGNSLVQVEIDKLNTAKGEVRQTSLHVYEFRDGKRWRETVFYPAGS